MSDVHGVTGESQALVFVLGRGRFGIDILQVQEIRGIDRPTQIPAAPDYFKGVTHLRGEFVPVIDLRVRLAVPVAEASAEGVTIILRVGTQRVGIVVDGVSEVIAMSPQDVKPPPAQFAPTAPYLRGLLSHGGETIVLLDIEALLAASEVKIEELAPVAE
jgi:purine-binding chemotaxis protein CheW